MGTWLLETYWTTCKEEIKDNTKVTSSWFLIYTELRCKVNHTSDLNIILRLSYDTHLVCPQNHRRSDIPTWGTDRVYSGNIAGWSDMWHSRGERRGKTFCTSGVTKKWVSEEVTHSTARSLLTYSSILPFSTIETLQKTAYLLFPQKTVCTYSPSS